MKYYENLLYFGIIYLGLGDTMKLKKKFDKLLDKNILKVIAVFLLLTPILDLITSISINVLHITNYVTYLKILFMFILVYYVLFISKKNKACFYYIGVFIYLILFILDIVMFKPNNLLSYELTNFLRTFYFPINLVSLYIIYQDKKLNIDLKKLTYLFLAYIVLILIPWLTKTGFNSYAYSKEGSTGWFNSTNEIGGIVSIILPIALYYLFKSIGFIKASIISVIICVVLFSMGTKVPVLSLGLIIFLWIMRYLVKIIKEKKYKPLISLICIFIIGIAGLIIVLPKTSFYKNIEIHLKFLKVDEVSDFASPRIIDKFIFSDRVSYYTKTKNNYLKSSIYEKVNGIGYSEYYFTEPKYIKMIEMDYFDIFFRHGVLGFIIFFMPYLYLLKKIYKRTKKLKKVDNELYTLYISVFLVLVLSLMSGHIIVAPSVSLVVCMIYLTILKKLEVIK